MRVYLPATWSMLVALHQDHAVTAESGWGFAVTQALESFYSVNNDADEIAYIAFEEASRASLRLLADETERPHRRVVITADIDDAVVDETPDYGDAVVKLSDPRIELSSIVAIHIDPESNEAATAQAIAAVDAADLGDKDAELTVGDALDNFLAWYDPSELKDLLARN